MQSLKHAVLLNEYCCSHCWLSIVHESFNWQFRIWTKDCTKGNLKLHVFRYSSNSVWGQIQSKIETLSLRDEIKIIRSYLSSSTHGKKKKQKVAVYARINFTRLNGLKQSTLVTYFHTCSNVTSLA